MKHRKYKVPTFFVVLALGLVGLFLVCCVAFRPAILDVFSNKDAESIENESDAPEPTSPVFDMDQALQLGETCQNASKYPIVPNDYVGWDGSMIFSINNATIYPNATSAINTYPSLQIAPEEQPTSPVIICEYELHNVDATSWDTQNPSTFNICCFTLAKGHATNHGEDSIAEDTLPVLFDGTLDELDNRDFSLFKLHPGETRLFHVGYGVSEDVVKKKTIANVAIGSTPESCGAFILLNRITIANW